MSEPPTDWPAARTPPPASGHTHDCPGGCGRQVTEEHLACPGCWYRLPRPLRTTVNDAYRQHGAGSTQHRNALRVAFRWYSDHPITTARRAP